MTLVEHGEICCHSTGFVVILVLGFSFLSPPSPFCSSPAGGVCVAGGVAGFLVAANKAHRLPLTQSSPPYKPGPDSTTLPVNSVLSGSAPLCRFLILASLLFRYLTSFCFLRSTQTPRCALLLLVYVFPRPCFSWDSTASQHPASTACLLCFLVLINFPLTQDLLSVCFGVQLKNKP